MVSPVPVVMAAERSSQSLSRFPSRCWWDSWPAALQSPVKTSCTKPQRATTLVLQKRNNTSVIVSTLYIDFSAGDQEDVHQYEVQCEPKRKEASVTLIAGPEPSRLSQAENLVDAQQREGGATDAHEIKSQDTSDIIFISICILAGLLMVIAVVGLVLL